MFAKSYAGTTQPLRYSHLRTKLAAALLVITCGIAAAYLYFNSSSTIVEGISQDEDSSIPPLQSQLVIDDEQDGIVNPLNPTKQRAEATPPGGSFKPSPSPGSQQLSPSDLLHQAGGSVFRLDTPPPGFKFSFAEKLPATPSEAGVRVVYANEASSLFFIVTQTNHKFPLIVHVPRNVVLLEADVNGLFAVAYDPGGPIGPILTWTDGTRWFEIQGNLGIDQMLDIARAMTF